MKKQVLLSVEADSKSLQAEGRWAQCYKAGNQVFMQGQTGIRLEDYTTGEVRGVGDPVHGPVPPGGLRRRTTVGAVQHRRLDRRGQG